MARQTIQWLTVAAASVAVLQWPAFAQEFNDIQAVITPQLDIERSRQLRRVVRERGEDALRQRMNPEAVAPLFYDGEQPVVDEMSAAPVGVNVWFDASNGWLRDTNPSRAYDGTQYVLSAGADRTFGERWIAGAIVYHSGSDVDNQFLPGNSTTRGYGIGPYAAVFLADTIVMTGSVLHGWTDNEAVSGVVTADYGSRDWTANVEVTSYHFVGDLRLAPRIGVSYSDSRDDAYTDSMGSSYPAETTRTTAFVFGARVAYPIALENGMTLEPSLEAEGEWSFARQRAAASAVAIDSAMFDANVTAGLDVGISDALSMSLAATLGGLAKPDYRSATVNGRLSAGF